MLGNSIGILLSGLTNEKVTQNPTSSRKHNASSPVGNNNRRRRAWIPILFGMSWFPSMVCCLFSCFCFPLGGMCSLDGSPRVAYYLHGVCVCVTHEPLTATHHKYTQEDDVRLSLLLQWDACNKRGTHRTIDGLSPFETIAIHCLSHGTIQSPYGGSEER